MNPLDNPAWTALTTLHADLAVGSDLARRYPDDLTSIAAVAASEQLALDELATLVREGEWTSLPATLAGVEPLVRSPLVVKFTKTLVQMVYAGRPAVAEGNAELHELSQPDIPDMLALAALTQPGPFRSNTYKFGGYVGIRVNGVLAAMGGLRMHLPGYREISAICSHPDFRGRGYARIIVARLVAAICDEGLTPFLHFESGNLGARALYASLGFVERARLPLVVVEKV